MPEPIRKRLSREESRAQTRGRLLDSARELFIKAGIEATSIEQVTEAAGYSRGAFYSNFESKDALICAVLELELRKQQQRLDAIFSIEPNANRMAAIRNFYLDFATDVEGCLFLVSMQMYALQHPGIRLKIAELLRSDRFTMVEKARIVVEELEKLGTPSPASPEVLVLSLQAQALGMCVSHMVEHESIDSEQIRQALLLTFDHLAHFK
jgi:AcrR family transcriptional regulator